VVNVQSLKRRWHPASAMLAGIALSPSQLATVSLLPNETQQQAARTLSYEAFLPSTNQLDPFLSLQLGTSLERQFETDGSDPAAATFGFGGGATGSVPTINSAASVQVACEELARELEPAWKYWNRQTVSSMPGLLAAHSMAVSASGKSTNQTPEGQAVAWCRPAPIPFAESSPLASRAFWQPVAVLAFGMIVFWLSRGIRLPS